MKRFRLLRADEIECRISEIAKNGSKLSLLLYKTARTDADLLDETVGPENWENDFKLVDGVLYGGIGIQFPDKDKPVWKWDAGTESNTEAEKGRASDAFKRAGSKHGIGRELYSAPRISVPNTMCNIKEVNGKWKCYDNFEVAQIGYDERERINSLVITLKGKPVFTFGKEAPKETPKETPRETPKREEKKAFICADCRKEILPYVDGKGVPVKLESHAARSEKLFGRLLCLDCVAKEKEAISEN